MRIRPLAFSPEMVLALRAGRKTQTRRVLRTQPTYSPVADGGLWEFPWGAATSMDYMPVVRGHRTANVCPHGMVGDFLWVREAWRAPAYLNDCNAFEIDARARFVGFEPGGPMDPRCALRYEADGEERRDWAGVKDYDWRPWGRYRHARFMPRWAARLYLQITRLRLERVQLIDEADAEAEGCYAAGGGVPDARWQFRGIWQTLNANRGSGWDGNPWVWVLDFHPVPQEVVE